MLTPATLTYLPTSYCFFIVTSPSSPSSFILAQCVLEEMASREAELGGLREKAHRLWEGQAAGKGFVHRVSQLSAQYLALSNLTKVTLPPSRSPAPPFLSLYCISVSVSEKLQHAEMCLAQFIYCLSQTLQSLLSCRAVRCCSMLFAVSCIIPQSHVSQGCCNQLALCKKIAPLYSRGIYTNLPEPSNLSFTSQRSLLLKAHQHKKAKAVGLTFNPPKHL